MTKNQFSHTEALRHPKSSTTSFSACCEAVPYPKPIYESNFMLEMTAELLIIQDGIYG
jgi:hypothetical protein